MSHLASIKSQIVDIDCLRRALEKMGLTLQVGGRPRFYNSGREADIECDYLVPLPGRYDLGLKRKGEGYEFVCDSELMSGSFGRGSEGRAILGENAGRLMDQYVQAVAENQAAMGNYTLSQEVIDGETFYYLDRYNVGG